VSVCLSTTVFISRLAGNLTGAAEYAYSGACSVDCRVYLEKISPAGGLGGCNWPMAPPESSTGLAFSSNPSQQASKSEPTRPPS
jgi:hypothetical protein